MVKKTNKVKKIIKNIFAYLLLILIFFIIIFLIFILIFKNNYNKWESQFLSSDIIFLDLDENIAEREESLEEKILVYNQEKSEYSFIQLTLEESMILFYRALDESLPDIFEVQKMALAPYYGNWFLYAEIQMYNSSLWFCFNLKKEPVQSVDIYVDDIFVGNMSLKDTFLKTFVTDVNEGVSRSIQLINDGNFAGRVFENIELTEDYLIIRSMRFDF